MTLYVGVALKPGDLMDLEFLTAGRARVAAVVRNRTGFCFGLEFLTPLGTEGPKPPSPAPHVGKPNVPAFEESTDLHSTLRRKELEMRRLQQEIATLRTFGKF